MAEIHQHFHAGLLREFAAADVMHRRQGPGAELAMLRKHCWYYPAGQDTGWTAWGAVVELALRRLAVPVLAGLISRSMCRRLSSTRRKWRVMSRLPTYCHTS